MKTLTLNVLTSDTVDERFICAMNGDEMGEFISFPSFDLLWKIISPKRLAILRAMVGGGEMSIRSAARRVARDIKAVHADVQALLAAGIIEKNGEKILFPYDQIHVDFVVSNIAA
ncbi:hypothetical protein REG_1951 [Candidatus Regiella insecticola LSR1]|uniref:Uncharacterized protein n=1 Tax=Candidatus Regiella insecticola LSR1 TaxID=663321 RepID=E0WV36_9ENTR|nr:transcriptional regulator [Candidatus Regiella insecticola]EFL91133.1 hypothetical protein REG_1951 [Candidatus Regiella insecticola LSR1]